MAALIGNNYTALNFGVGGHTLVQMEAVAVASIDPLINAQRNHVVFLGGTNDFGQGASAATVISRTVSYAANRQTAGAKTIEVGLLPRSDAGAPVDFETKRQAVRTSRLAVYTVATIYPNIWGDGNGNYYIDMAADTTIGESGDSNDLTYYSDKLHTTSAGDGVIAGYVAQAVSLISWP